MMLRKRVSIAAEDKEPKAEEEIDAKEAIAKEEVSEEKIEQLLPDETEVKSDVEFEEEAEKKTPEPEETELLTLPVTLGWRPPMPEKVFIAGDFNDWNPKSHPLTLDENGEWKIELEIPPGAYEYRFVVDGKWICDPNCEESVPNTFGSHNSLLSVK